MNIRYAVLAERLKVRARLRGLHLQPSEMTEERRLDAEEKLGYRLPETLRTLYLVYGPWALSAVDGIGHREVSRTAEQSDVPGDGDEPSASTEEVDRTVLGLAPEVAAALRQQPGSFISLGEDGIPNEDPESFVLIVFPEGDVGVVLDAHTGYLYFDEPDEEWSHLSFAAPSIEDWLERELDGGYRAQRPYWPQEEKKLAIVLEEGWIRLADGPRPALSLQQQPVIDPVEARRETVRLREETLSSAGPDPLDEAVDQQVRVIEMIPDKLSHVRHKWDQASIEPFERMLERYERHPDKVRAQI